jgi:hypothetical protein
MNLYARETSVSVEKSQADLKKLLGRYKADRIEMGSSERDGQAYVRFEFRDVRIEKRLTLPKAAEERFHRGKGGRHIGSASAYARWEQACRQQWRILLLLLQAQMEAVELGLYSVHQAFLADLLLPSGQPLGEAVASHLPDALKTGDTSHWLTMTPPEGKP